MDPRKTHPGGLPSTPRYTGVPTFFRADHIDMNLEQDRLAQVDIGIVGVPFDGGVTNRTGARDGPRSVRTTSAGFVRGINQATGVAPFAMGLKVADVGDAHVSNPYELQTSHADITQQFLALMKHNVTPLAVGGDHSVTLPIMRALGANGPVGLIHIDAHADTGDNYGGSRFHHGSPFKIAVEEGLLDPKRTIQIGIRGSVNASDMWKFSHDTGMRVVYMDEFKALGVQQVLAEIARVVGDGLGGRADSEGPVYISFDIDALDPSFAPGTGTPEIGGITTFEAQQLIRGIAQMRLDICGADLVEVAPAYDAADLTSLAGANLLHELLCVMALSVERRQNLG